jgi:membrane protease subunit (stomatin/prohibitin family)
MDYHLSLPFMSKTFHNQDFGAESSDKQKTWKVKIQLFIMLGNTRYGSDKNVQYAKEQDIDLI